MKVRSQRMRLDPQAVVEAPVVLVEAPLAALVCRSRKNRLVHPGQEVLAELSPASLAGLAHIGGSVQRLAIVRTEGMPLSAGPPRVETHSTAQGNPAVRTLDNSFAGRLAQIVAEVDTPFSNLV